MGPPKRGRKGFRGWWSRRSKFTKFVIVYAVAAFVVANAAFVLLNGRDGERQDAEKLRKAAEKYGRNGGLSSSGGAGGPSSPGHESPGYEVPLSVEERMMRDVLRLNADLSNPGYGSSTGSNPWYSDPVEPDRAGLYDLARNRVGASVSRELRDAIAPLEREVDALTAAVVALSERFPGVRMALANGDVPGLSDPAVRAELRDAAYDGSASNPFMKQMADQAIRNRLALAVRADEVVRELGTVGDSPSAQLGRMAEQVARQSRAQAKTLQDIYDRAPGPDVAARSNLSNASVPVHRPTVSRTASVPDGPGRAHAFAANGNHQTDWTDRTVTRA